MSNEVQVVDTPTGVQVVDKKEVELTPAMCNRKLGDKVIRISIKCKKAKTKDGKKDFNAIKGMKHLPVMELDENGEYINVGKKNRWLDMHFKKDAFKGIPAECEVHSPEDLTTGFLYVRAKGVQSPRVYKVTDKVDEDGNVVYEDGEAVLDYPKIWIKSDIVGFEPYVEDQDAFDYVEPDTVVEAKTQKVNEETGEIIEEDDDTSETNI